MEGLCQRKRSIGASIPGHELGPGPGDDFVSKNLLLPRGEVGVCSRFRLHRNQAGNNLLAFANFDLLTAPQARLDIREAITEVSGNQGGQSCVLSRSAAFHDLRREKPQTSKSTKSAPPRSPAKRADGVLLQKRTFAQRTQLAGPKPTKSSTKRHYRGGSMRQAFIPDPPTLGIKIVPPAALVPDVPSGCWPSKHILPNGPGGRHGVFPTTRGYPAKQGTATPKTP